MTKQKSKKQLTDAEYLEIFENFDPTKWRELTPEELAEHRERAKDAVIVEVEEIHPVE
jgi:DNA-directed RNA polymerase subunit F